MPSEELIASSIGATLGYFIVVFFFIYLHRIRSHITWLWVTAYLFWPITVTISIIYALVDVVQQEMVDIIGRRKNEKRN